MLQVIKGLFSHGKPASLPNVVWAGGAALAIAVITAYLAAPPRPAAQATTQKGADAVTLADLLQPGDLPDNVLGPENAPITIVEYASLSCPHCASFHKDILPKLKSKYIDTGKVRYILREFPHNDQAMAASILARCVDPLKYFAFIDMLFAKQEEWAFKQDALERLKSIAKQAGFTEERFTQCLADEKLMKGIKQKIDRGEELGVRNIPSFFVNGKPLRGHITLEKLEEAMAPHLKG